MNPLTEGKKITLGYDYFAKGFTTPQLSDAYYRLIADKRQERLLFETATIDEVDEVYNPGDSCDENDRLTTEEMLFEAVTIQKFARTDTKMAALVRVFNAHLKDKNIEAQVPIIGRPKKSGLFATVTVQIPFSDGQVVSIIFHSPDNNKMKITADDEIIAFRWLLNKRDITQAVSPENDTEVSLQEIGKRTAQLVEKNSTRFQVMQKDLVAQKKTLEEVKAQAEEAVKQHDELMGKLKDGQDASETADAKIANLRDRIEKQKAFNEDLQAKIDSLKAEKAGNDGKATGGGTPKNEAEMKAEQEVAAFEEKKTSWEQELTGRGFEITDPGNARYSTDAFVLKTDIGSKNGFYVGTLFDDGTKDEKTFKSATLSGLDAQIKKALAWIDKKLAEMKKDAEDTTARDQFVATATSDDVVTMSEDDYNAALKRFKRIDNIRGGKVEAVYTWAVRNRLEASGITDPQALMQKFLELYDKAVDSAKSGLRIGLMYAIEKNIPDYAKNLDLGAIHNDVLNKYDSVAQIIKDIASGTKTGEAKGDSVQDEGHNEGYSPKVGKFREYVVGEPLEMYIEEFKKYVDEPLDAYADTPGIDSVIVKITSGQMDLETAKKEYPNLVWGNIEKDIKESNRREEEYQLFRTSTLGVGTAGDAATPEPPSVQTAKDILSGKYDDFPLGEVLKLAEPVMDLDEDKYADLMDQVDAYTTVMTKKAVQAKMAA